MRALIQRVSEARVDISGHTMGRIGRGWLILLGVGQNDTENDVDLLTSKIIGLRAFADSDGKMNLSLQDIQGSALVVSQFTLYADCRKGRRPSFTQSAPPQIAKELYESFISNLRSKNTPVETGQFGADMQVQLTNDGPVTILLDTKDASDFQQS